MRVKGKRCLELGAGMGLAGAAMALMGAHVTFTDLESVLPLLRQNVQNNLTPTALRRGSWGGAVGMGQELPCMK